MLLKTLEKASKWTLSFMIMITANMTTTDVEKGTSVVADFVCPKVQTPQISKYIGKKYLLIGCICLIKKKKTINCKKLF